MGKENPVAKSLANRLYQPKVVKPKKGKGSYTRKGVKPLSTGGTLKTKIKKVAKGLEKASKSHAKQAKTLNSIKLKAGKRPKSTVNKAGNYTKPGMRKRLFEKIKAGGKGGAPGQWSARKAQMLAQAYKKAGGGYTT
jgi:stalled ribosome alternative rescue factor ArfA